MKLSNYFVPFLLAKDGNAEEQEGLLSLGGNTKTMAEARKYCEDEGKVFFELTLKTLF